MSWSTGMAWVCVGLILVCVLIVALGSIRKADRAAARDWRKFCVRNKPLPDSRSSIEVFRRIIRGGQ